MASCTSYIGSLLVLVAAIMGCISIGTPYWAESVPPGEFHWGLWQSCVNGTCADLVNDNQHAVAGIGVAISVLTFALQKGNRKFTGYSGPIEYGWSYWVCVATGAALLVGMVSFVCEIPNAKRRAPYAYVPPAVSRSLTPTIST